MFRYGISLGSLLPWSFKSWFWPFGSPMRAAEWTKEIGYEFLQILPFRGVTGQEKWPIPVLYYEEAWNLTTWLGEAAVGQILKKINFGRFNHWPGLKDWIFFPTGDKSTQVANLFPGTEIAHAPTANALYEINPDDRVINPDVIQDLCKNARIRLCLDPQHISRPPYSDGPNPLEIPGGPKELIRKLAPWIQVVHVKGNNDLNWGTITTLLRCNNHMPNIDFVAEHVPILSSSANCYDEAKTALATMKSIVESV